MYFNFGRFTIQRKYSSLSAKDLLEARDAYHIHLAHLENVIGTAIGRYRLRSSELDPEKDRAKWKRKRYGKDPEPRMLANTTIREHSSPCVLVFVKKWWTYKELRDDPTQAIPRELYLPDGRVVPTCVVYAPPDPTPALDIDRFNFSSSFIGGGYSCYTTAQNVERAGSLGCLVTKEGTLYALTSRHVAGETEREVYSLINNKKIRIGISSGSFVTKKKFPEVYPGWPGQNVFATMDVALIRLDDLNHWTSQVFGIGEIGPLIDMNTSTINLDLIGCPVRAFGSVSGPIEGEIHGFFYRYRTVAGFDYIADVVLGPRNLELDDKYKPAKENSPLPSMETRPGDSGTIWFVDPPSSLPSSTERDELVPEQGARARKLRPVAIQWAGQKLMGTRPEKPTHLALGTFLSTVCRELDVEIVPTHNNGLSEYWGKVGHFKIGYKACDLLSNPNLQQLMLANQHNIGFPDSDLLKGKEFKVGRDAFIPLADVPDYKWVASNSPARKSEAVQHFGDIDEDGPSGETSLLNLCVADLTTNLRATVWRDFYNLFDGKEYGPEEGVLPFRVWQGYKAMLHYIRNGDTERFVAVAGVLSHYVGDACQPLHSSKYHHGKGPPFRRDDPRYEEYHNSKEYKIHSIYEALMFERHPVQLIAEINAATPNQGVQPIARTKAGQPEGMEAAHCLFRLMHHSYNLIPPLDLIAVDDVTLNQPQRAALFFNAYHAETAQLIADGTQLLAQLWESAWAEADGDQNIPQADLVTIPESNLTNISKQQTFYPAKTIDEFVTEGY